MLTLTGFTVFMPLFLGFTNIQLTDFWLIFVSFAYFKRIMISIAFIHSFNKYMKRKPKKEKKSYSTQTAVSFLST